MPCTGTGQAWHSDVLDHAHADLLAFSVVPFTAPWHRSLARACPGRLPGMCLASLCTRLPGLPASLGWNHRSFPLSSLLRHQLAQHRQIPVSLSFPCWGIDVSGDAELWIVLTVFKWQPLFFRPRWFLYMHILQRLSWVCQRSNRKLKEFWIHLDIIRIQSLQIIFTVSCASLIYLVFSSARLRSISTK